ncbi:hypothetical protein SNOG_02757 [Parastagonospora nodorum SN15]|uniref:Diaminopimelate epimerase-like protein n=1 Tax=Phaeosphaeria nodorum (strain SN15 / ATCC MYA-4574 / FGSC 10173) TaxID=321614 RepID=Q0UZQ7_PHANO|nr:hypothetical protein SNOG_02757 [Parastagonospora nodorum SN15]EAT89488.2 hypothetical protein SNOG_02757 [Parastagonospora nodorum SN15]
MSSPSQLEFVTVDVFTTERYSGNPLAIIRIPHGVTMTQEQKQMIAREFNLSESTFLHEKSPSAPGNTWVVDIFLTTAEIPFAGHPTIGTACYVLSRAAQERGLEDGVIEAGFQLKAGPVSLVYDVAKKTARAAIPHDVSVPPEPRLARGHEQRKFGIKDDFAIVSIVKGMTFVLVELDNLEALEMVSVAGQGISISGLDEGWDKTFIGTYFFVRMGKNAGGATMLRTRMIEGSLEDPATGSAASDLVAYLSLNEGGPSETLKFEIIQGVEMGRRSEIFIDVEMDSNKSIAKIVLEGSAVRVMEGRLAI